MSQDVQVMQFESEHCGSRTLESGMFAVLFWKSVNIKALSGLVSKRHPMHMLGMIEPASESKRVLVC